MVVARARVIAMGHYSFQPRTENKLPNPVTQSTIRIITTQAILLASIFMASPSSTYGNKNVYRSQRGHVCAH